MTTQPSESAARIWLLLGIVDLLGACCVSRYVHPDWTGAIVGGMVAVGVLLVLIGGEALDVDD